MGYGIFGILLGLLIGNIYGLIFIIPGIFLICLEISTKKSAKSEMKVSLVDRSKYVVDKIGGTGNIDINLSKYSYDSQLIILKNKSILVGYNNYKTEKIINFDSIINVDIRINNIKKESSAGYTHYHENIIESIIVYIHTNECTEELIFKYSSYETNQAQEKYNEILKGLNRFKVMIDTNNLDKESNIYIKEKSIPEQIKEYKGLLDIGAITESEYKAKKSELLSK